MAQDIFVPDTLALVERWQVNHALRQARRRYKIDLPEPEYWVLVARIHDDEAEWVRRTRRGTDVYRLAFRGRILVACFDPDTQMIATFFAPPGRARPRRIKTHKKFNGFTGCRA